MVAALAALAWLMTSFGCTSATIEEQDTDPRFEIVDGRGDYEWEPDTGWVRPEGGAWGASDTVRRESGEALQAEAYADALVGYLELESRIEEGDTSIAEIQFNIAECYYNLGHYDEAVDYYRRVYREGKPEENIAAAARQRVYEIAMDFLHGRSACRTLGFRHTCPRHGIKLLLDEEDGLIREYPFLSFADEALMEIGQYYYEDKQYPEAVPIYEQIVNEYSTPGFSTWTGPAQFQLGLCWYQQVRGADYDERTIHRAIKEFSRYQEIGGAHTQDAGDYIRELREMLAAKYLRIAKFYLRESEPRAARIYLREVLDRFTNSTAAREAREIQRQLDRLAVGG